MKNNESILAEWTHRIPEGEIRRLLKYQVKYYFGGGLPGALAIEELAQIVINIGKELLDDIHSGNNATALHMFNYDKTPGSDNLRRILMTHLVNRQQLQFEPEFDQ